MAPVASPSNHLTRYPRTLELRAGATSAGDGPIGSVIAAFTWCVTGTDCNVVLEKADGTQATVPTDVGDTPVSLSPDGMWLVYLRHDATVLRNLVTGAVQNLPAYRKPLAWSPNGRWLMFAGSYGGDFIVRDVTTGTEAAHLHPSPPATATAAPIEPAPTGPYYPAGVTDQGRVVRYERPENPTPQGAFLLDVVEPASMAGRVISAPLGSPELSRPIWQSPVAAVLGDTLYLQLSVNGSLALLPVSLTNGEVARPVTVTDPVSHKAVQAPNGYAGDEWSTVAALPSQVLVYRTRATSGAGDELIVVDPTTGRSRVLAHIREGGAVALAALPS
jgi:hypothetical protein